VLDHLEALRVRLFRLTVFHEQRQLFSAREWGQFDQQSLNGNDFVGASPRLVMVN
jgi:hypothetical protein